MKSIISVSVDTEVIAEVRLRKVPLSKVINAFLRDYLEINQDDANIQSNYVRPSKYDAEIARLKAQTVDLENKRKKENKDNKRVVVSGQF